MYRHSGGTDLSLWILPGDRACLKSAETACPGRQDATVGVELQKEHASAPHSAAMELLAGF